MQRGFLCSSNSPRDLISRPEMDSFSKRLSDRRRIRSAVIGRVRKCRRIEGYGKGRETKLEPAAKSGITPREFAKNYVSTAMHY